MLMLLIPVNFAETIILIVWNAFLRMFARSASHKNMQKMVNVNFVLILMLIVWSAVMKNARNAVLPLSLMEMVNASLATISMTAAVNVSVETIASNVNLLIFTYKTTIAGVAGFLTETVSNAQPISNVWDVHLRNITSISPLITVSHVLRPFPGVKSVTMLIVARIVSICIIWKEDNVWNAMLCFRIAKYVHLLMNAPSVMITISSKRENAYFVIISYPIANSVKVLLPVRPVRWILCWTLISFANFAKMWWLTVWCVQQWIIVIAVTGGIMSQTTTKLVFLVELLYNIVYNVLLTVNAQNVLKIRVSSMKALLSAINVWIWSLIVSLAKVLPSAPSVTLPRFIPLRISACNVRSNLQDALNVIYRKVVRNVSQINTTFLKELAISVLKTCKVV